MLKHLVIWSMLLAGCAVAPPAPVVDAVPGLIEEPKARRPQTHIIQPGDTLVSIALEYGLDYHELALWNGISDPNAIYAGDEIKLSAPPNLPRPAAVKPQTLPAIAPLPTTAPIITPVITPTVPTPNAADDSAPILDDAPIKNTPLATLYPYNAAKLKALRAAHAAQEAVSVAAVASPPVVGSPSQVRERFGLDWSWPTTGAIIRRFNEVSKGVDFSGQKGAPIYAVAAGKVVYTGTGVKSYGRLVILKHNNDYLSAYAHSDSILVEEGQQIARGEQIATVGDSGAAQVMLHLEIRKAGKPFDPLQVLPSRP